MSEQLDLSDKSNWTVENADKIAYELGFVSDEDFANNLALFIATTVEPAKMSTFLKVVAIGFFKSCKLEK